MIKQVIVVRKDLKMRRGKEIAQGAHASMAWLAELVASYVVDRGGSELPLTEEQALWLTGSFAKVCLQVESEQELLEIYQAAIKAGLTARLITDAGRTEFNGVPTHTCVGIGPNRVDAIDKVTGHLKLY
jgi:PTH2 family peptidyl-tRNA hydrolase